MPHANTLVIPNTREARVRNRTILCAAESPAGSETVADSATTRNQA
jgi:hypothetical protein